MNSALLKKLALPFSLNFMFAGIPQWRCNLQPLNYTTIFYEDLTICFIFHSGHFVIYSKSL